MSSDSSVEVCRIAPRHPLPIPGSRQMWRVIRGVLRVDSALEGGASRFVRMAMPGDVVGVEHWAGTNDALNVFALTPAEVVPLNPSGVEAIDILVETVVVAHQRSREALELRSGPVAKRVQRLLLLLAQGEGRCDGDMEALVIPHLVDMSEILDAAPETISRVFSSLRGLDYVKERKPQRARFDVAAIRELRSVVGMSASGALRSDRTVDLDGNAPVVV